MPKTSARLGAAVLVFLGGALAVWWLASHEEKLATSSPAAVASPTPVTPEATPAFRSLTPAAPNRLADFTAALAVADDSDSARKLLGEIRAWLRALPAGEAVVAIRQFLDGSRDVAVPLEFTLAADGSLASAPSLRVWLLDTFTLVAPQAAADYAQRVLVSSNSADEWAVALRGYGIGRPDDPAFLKAKAGELLARTDWRAKPSAGYLEAFDVLVHTRASEFAPQLATLVQDKTNRAAGHAAFLTLDRLIQQDAVKVLTQLQERPESMAGREQTRANYFARVDVRDPQQRTLLETYLLDPRRTPEELDTFAGIYPNANFMISHNLLTRTATPAHDELLARDREALRSVESWLIDPRFAAQKIRLERLRERLRQFVR